MIVVRVLNVILVLFFVRVPKNLTKFNSLQKLGRFLDVPNRCNKRFKLPDADAEISENFRENLCIVYTIITFGFMFDRFRRFIEMLHHFHHGGGKKL